MPFLFADVSIGEVGGWTGLIGGLVAFLSTAVTAYLKLKYDATIIELKAENKRLTEAERECRDDYKELKGTVAVLDQKLESERQRSAEERHKLETEINRQRDLKHEMNGRLMQLQAQLHLQGVTVDIKPLKGGSGEMAAPPQPPPPPKDPF